MTRSRLRSAIARLLPLLGIVLLALLLAACAAPSGASPSGQRRRDGHADTGGGHPARAGQVRARPDLADRLAVHAALPDVLHPAGPPRPALRQHRDRDHRADGRAAGPDDAALPAPDRVVQADAAPRAGAQGDPETLQERPGQGPGRPAAALQGARHQPALGLPAHPARDAAAHPALQRLQRRPQQLQPPGDADRRRPDDRRPALLGGADVQRGRARDPVPGSDRVQHQLEPAARGLLPRPDRDQRPRPGRRRADVPPVADEPAVGRRGRPERPEPADPAPDGRDLPADLHRPTERPGRPASSSTSSSRRPSRSSSSTCSPAGAGCSRSSAGSRHSPSATRHDSRSRFRRPSIPGPGRPRRPSAARAGKAAAVDKTIRHKERGRQGRRGRRR